MNCLPVFFFNKIWSIVRYNYKDPSFQYIQYFELQIKFVDTRGGWNYCYYTEMKTQ